MQLKQKIERERYIFFSKHIDIVKKCELPSWAADSLDGLDFIVHWT